MLQIFWYIYAAILGTSTIAFIIHGGRKEPAVNIDIAVSILTWVGLFGFITQTQILSSGFWKAVFFGAILWDIIFSLMLKRHFDESEGGGTVAAMIFGFVLLAPLYYALFQYAF